MADKKYGGRFIEDGTPEQIFDNPQHPRLKDFLNKVLNVKGDASVIIDECFKINRIITLMEKNILFIQIIQKMLMEVPSCMLLIVIQRLIQKH